MKVSLIHSVCLEFGQTPAGSHVALPAETVVSEIDSETFDSAAAAEFMAAAKPRVVLPGGIQIPLPLDREGLSLLVRLGLGRGPAGTYVVPYMGYHRFAFGEPKLREASVQLDASNLRYQREVLRG